MEIKTCIIIVGPTAVGKTALAVDIAKQFQTDIISADSRQCFTELNIAVAKPSAAQLAEVKHYFINSHSIHDEVNAAVFEQYALAAVDEIFKNHEIAVMVGGTGLYIRAFCGQIDHIPAVDISIRRNIIEGFEENGLDWLQQKLATADPEYFATGEIQNPQRMMRALEVKLSTGQSIRAYQTRQQKARDFNVLKIGLTLDREELYQNVNWRVDDMMRQGLLEEARSLFQFRELNALQTVGYRELFDFFEGRCTVEHAVDKIKQHTRHYAKRQLTWFRRDTSIEWFSPFSAAAIAEYISRKTKQAS